jgi:hypothetical protein
MDDTLPPWQIDPGLLPPPLTTAEPGSFAQFTFRTRIPDIIEDTLRHNDFAPAIRNALGELNAEITGGHIRLLNEAAPDTAFWNTVSQPFAGRTWLEVPWFWAETYFYRRLLEATAYFQPGPGYGFDPFAAIKDTEWRPDAAPRALEDLLAALPAPPADRLAGLLVASLWGNRVDLSYQAVASLGVGSQGDGSHLLVDDRDLAWQVLSRGSSARLAPRLAPRLALIADNSGTELAMDLALVDHLLTAGLARAVELHLKQQPFFVSDAMPADVLRALDALSAGGPHAAELVARLRQYLGHGRLSLHTHWFYTTSLFYFQMPADLRAGLAGAALVILKGDANYRRLFGDAHWPPATPIGPWLTYFPASLLSLRTLKSEIILGLRPGEAERLTAEDPDWLVNGKRGVIQGRL